MWPCVDVLGLADDFAVIDGRNPGAAEQRGDQLGTRFLAEKRDHGGRVEDDASHWRLRRAARRRSLQKARGRQELPDKKGPGLAGVFGNAKYGPLLYKHIYIFWHLDGLRTSVENLLERVRCGQTTGRSQMLILPKDDEDEFPKLGEFFTKKGTRIKTELHHDDPGFKGRELYRVERTWHPDWRQRRPPCGGYNCWGMTFVTRRTGIYDETLVEKILEDEYREVEPASTSPTSNLVISLYIEKSMRTDPAPTPAWWCRLTRRGSRIPSFGS